MSSAPKDLLLQTRIAGLEDSLREAFKERRAAFRTHHNSVDFVNIDSRCRFLSQQLRKAKKELEGLQSKPREAFMPLFFEGRKARR